MMQPRQCIVLIGDRPWCLSSSEQLLKSVSETQICHLTNESSTFQQLEPQKAKSILGQEFSAIIFDGLDSLNADSLGISLGTIRAGGVLVLWLPANQESQPWLSRFHKIVASYQQKSPLFKVIKQDQQLPQIHLEQSPVQPYQTDEQQQAIAAIKHVVYGHRKRPLVLSADRGRGKSAALGLAAAELLLEGKQKILITAPSLQTAKVCFEHAHQHLTGSEYSKGRLSLGDAEIRFIAPDDLLANKPEADLLLVDEAAAIPVVILSQFIEHYSRLVFASTIHGYEGTGRGFSIRFQSILEQTMPGWRLLTLKIPIRWEENDQLEQFCFDALLLNASPVKQEAVSDATIANCSVEKIDKNWLVDNKESLRELFGLMVLAHYRTRPSDLQMMLDREDISLYVVKSAGHIIATSWSLDEGEIESDLAQQIYLGERRLQGQLLPQSLLNHAGIEKAGGLRYRRIMRIAVHPALLRQGFARILLEQIKSDAALDEIDILGASYSASADLVNFWHKTGFEFCHIGVQQDHVSSAYTVIMMQSMSEAGREVVAQCQQSLSIQWPDYLLTRYQDLELQQALTLSRLIPLSGYELNTRELADVNSFVYGQRGYEFCQFSIRKYVLMQLTRSNFEALELFHQQLLMMVVLQNRAWPEALVYLSLTGKASLIKELKTALQLLLADTPD